MGFKSRAPASSAVFSDQLLEFLAELEQNNYREWFAANKLRYEQQVREPALDFIRQMGPGLARHYPRFVASDRKVGGSLMRVYRDTRFARDKTPYKTNVGIHFRHGTAADVHAPGLYVHISLEGCFVGVGVWRPDSMSLGMIRRAIVERPRDWLAARDDAQFRAHFELTGESLTRMPRGFTEGLPHAADVRRKDHTAGAPLGLDDVLGPDLVDYCTGCFAAAKPYVDFLTRAVGAVC